jgi:hypothetical protein
MEIKTSAAKTTPNATGNTDHDEAGRLKLRKKRRRGFVLIAVGFFALVTPFTPGSWLIFVGLEMVGVHTVWGEKMLAKFRKSKNSEFSAKS